MTSLSLGSWWFPEGHQESAQLVWAKDCVRGDFAEPLQKTLGWGFGPRDLLGLCDLSAQSCSINCFRLLLEQGVPCAASDLHTAARTNRVDILELAVRHGTGWCSMLPGIAACAGNVRFLMCMFEAGCPIWIRAYDGEPTRYGLPPVATCVTRSWDSLADWKLAVSSDLVRSGPVLLYAAQKGAPLTRRMRRMLKNVRRRALALEGCFHRATRLSQEGASPEWGGYGPRPH
jgi:hypothetical protein